MLLGWQEIRVILNANSVPGSLKTTDAGIFLSKIHGDGYTPCKAPRSMQAGPETKKIKVVFMKLISRGTPRRNKKYETRLHVTTVRVTTRRCRRRFQLHYRPNRKLSMPRRPSSWHRTHPSPVCTWFKAGNQKMSRQTQRKVVELATAVPCTRVYKIFMIWQTLNERRLTNYQGTNYSAIQHRPGIEFSSD